MRRLNKKKRLIASFKTHLAPQYQNLNIVVEKKEYNWLQFLLWGWLIPWKVYEIAQESKFLLGDMGGILHAIDWTPQGREMKSDAEKKIEKNNREFNEKYPHLFISNL